ncbi:MAG: hypothetical protein ABEL04_14465 [Salinibacter sp.]|uniref:5-methylcytosine restriction system specificity protein McrC n=1 Tax=Salinibacter sp. TaxID=2065818 RepID=UPI0035D44D62
MSGSPHSKVIEVEDTSQAYVPASFLLEASSTWGQESAIGQLARQFLDRNAGVLQDFEVEGDVVYYGDSVRLSFETGRTTGALPLISPTTGQVDYGLVIRPRFGWQGVGRALLHTGWRRPPDLLSLSSLPQSDRRVPPWVLASTVLRRIDRLLGNLTREFQITEEDRRQPRGRIQWGTYVENRAARGQFLSVPCRYPELQDDAFLRGAIKSTLQKQRRSLERERGAGPMVLQLIEKCQRLLREVQEAPSVSPDPARLRRFQSRQPLRQEVFERGLEAIEWTLEERGLAGLGELSGLPWRLPMDTFFEAWVETVAERYCKLRGGTLQTGREDETVVPLSWNPPYLGSQSSLRPDLVIDKGDQTIILDAKYKSHWEELDAQEWRQTRQSLRDQHRTDLLQVLAYANLADKSHVTTCLIYPCHHSTWESLAERDRLAHRAELGAGSRTVELVLAAVSMETSPDEAAQALKAAISE